MEFHGGPAQHTLPGLTWRAMTAADLDAVITVAAEAFPNHFEARACYVERLNLYPQGCRVLTDEAGGVCGYVFAYPWTADAAPPLNVLIGGLPADAGVFYLHDLALLRSARGGGHAKAAVETVVEMARDGGWPALGLVAINEAAPFWEGRGFEVADPPGMAEKLASYGADARYMIRRLTDSLRVQPLSAIQARKASLR